MQSLVSFYTVLRDVNESGNLNTISQSLDTVKSNLIESQNGLLRILTSLDGVSRNPTTV